MRYGKIFVLVTLFLALACGPKVAVKIVDADGSAGKTGSDGANTLQNTGGSTWEAPPQKFKPRPIPYRQRDAVAIPPLSEMPSLTLRLGECYGIYDEDDSLAIAGSAAGSGSAGVGAPAGMRGSRSKTSSVERAKKKRSSSGATPKQRKPSRNGDAIDGLVAPTQAPAEPQSPPSTSSASKELAAEEAPVDMARPDADYEMGASESPSVEGELIAASDDVPKDAYEDWGQSIYLSNDDSMSLSSAQRVMYAIDNFLPLPSEHIRPHELLNYFSFDTAEVAPGHDFSVYPDIVADADTPAGYTLGLSVSGRTVTKDSRRNVALTWVIDRSGSMNSEGRMEYLKRGLKRSLNELKRGDMVHMVLFDHNVCTPVENFVVGRDDMNDLSRAIDALRPMGSTDIHSGLRQGYAIADRSYQGHHSNRLVLITDALTNTGVTDEELISMISKYFDMRRIRLSGVGVGREFNDSLLDRLTEKGKGAYVFLGSEAETDAVFGEGFISLIETVALDVHFRLHLPKSLRMNVFYGEESSVYKEDVQAIHYFANTSQLFLSDLMARGGALRPQDDIMLSIEYQDPESGEQLVEEYAFNLGEVLQNEPYNTRKGKLIIAWIDMLAIMAERAAPARYSYQSGSWDDAEAYGMCEDGKEQLHVFSEGLEEDPEVRRVLQLWDKYCMRYAVPEKPVSPTHRKRNPKWPGAQPESER